MTSSFVLALVAICLLPVVVSAQTRYEAKGKPPVLKVHMRKNIATLTPPQLAALRKGIQVMQSRKPNDPTSWTYQANMHGTDDTPALAAWSTCQHGSFLFLSWHRIYLFYFERILRQASGDATLALPYWNYTQTGNRALPAAFRTPADQSNPLFVSQRNPAVNAGAQLSPSAVTFSTAFSRIPFASNTSGSSSFGGLRVPGAVHFSNGHGALELGPHNAVHVQVGGWMSDPNMAARDPIFWLHHANIDRLWESWLKLAGGRTNPPASDTVWMTTPFVFFDENGTQVKLTGAQIVTIATQLRYRYDVLSTVPSPLMMTSGGADAGGSRSQPQTAVTAPKPISIAGKPVQVELPLSSASARMVESAAAASGATPIKVKLEDVSYDQGAYLEVYVNLPAGTPAPGPSSPHYAGSFAPFEPKDHQAKQFEVDITDAVRALRAKKLLKNDHISITLVPVTPAAPNLKEPAPVFKVQIGRLSIVTGQ
jgi:tyrosinase